MSQNISSISFKSTNILLWASLVALLVTAYLVGVNGANGSVAEAWNLATTHHPETYSELYFDSPATLPTYAPAGKPELVTFRVVNHQGAKRLYQYQTVVTVGGAVTTRNGSVTLMDGQSAQEHLGYTVPKPNEAVTISVKLLGTSQQLSFRSRS